MTTTTAPSRRWIRFSLRTLLVVVTLFGAWLGYELRWIRERHEILADFPRWSAFEGDPSVSNQPRAPGLLWLFGEPGYAAVSRLVPVTDTMTINYESWPPASIDAELKRAEGLFPEAMVGAAPVTWTEAESRGSLEKPWYDEP